MGKLNLVIEIMVFAIPIAITIFNLICMLFMYKQDDIDIGRFTDLRNLVWAITLIVGSIASYLWLDLTGVKFFYRWNTQLYGNDLHQPVWSGALLTLAVIATLGFIGALVLKSSNVNGVPPLITVFCIASMYLALTIMVIFAIQLSNEFNYVWPCYIFLANVLMMSITIIRMKISQWNSVEQHCSENYGKNAYIKKLNTILLKSEKWPVYALLFMIPILGIIVAVLVLFGQEPTAIIKVWTETSDWALSQRIGPQNLPSDGHYLCTVAAGGHKRIVKPLRMGERHGHEIVVNRQLMIANAFENVLEEKTPRMHRGIRDFYDKYGFPIANYIRNNKIACDITYFVMKPLEWIFLVVLYLVDVNPENRIAVQYMPRKQAK